LPPENPQCAEIQVIPAFQWRVARLLTAVGRAWQKRAPKEKRRRLDVASAFVFASVCYVVFLAIARLVMPAVIVSSVVAFAVIVAMTTLAFALTTGDAVIVTSAVVSAVAVFLFPLTAGDAVIMTSAVVSAVAVFLLPFTASDTGIMTFAIVTAMAAFTLPFTAINTGVMANSIVVPMTTFAFVVTASVIATLHPIHGRHALSTVAETLMDAHVRHASAASAHSHARGTPAACFTRAAGKQR